MEVEIDCRVHAAAVQTFRSYVVPGLRALGPFHSLTIVTVTSQDVPALMPELAALELQALSLTMWPDQWPEDGSVPPVATLPSCRALHLSYEAGNRKAASLDIMWAALCSRPGVRHLGSADAPLVDGDGFRILGCAGMPIGFPLAVVVWGDLGLVHGVPVSAFVREASAPDKWVWRSAAAMGLVV